MQIKKIHMKLMSLIMLITMAKSKGKKGLNNFVFVTVVATNKGKLRSS